MRRANAGSSVSGTGDINGDTVDDLIVGANEADSGTGNVYVIYGGVSLPGTIDLSSTNADVTVVGAFAGGQLGFDVATGDVRLHGTIVEVDPSTGRATSIERLCVTAEEADALADTTAAP